MTQTSADEYNATSTSRKRKSTEPPDTTLQEAVDFFADEDASSKTRSSKAVQHALETLEGVAERSGLPGHCIPTLVDVAMSGRFAARFCVRLIKALIPETCVPSEAVVKAVSWIATCAPALSMQALLVKWIILIYEALDSTEELHCLYGIIFHFLQSDAMCPFVCHLLYLLTRKEDVRMFRVRTLLALQQKMGAQPHLLGLLSIYNLYCPQLVHLVLPRSRQKFFKSIERAWVAKVRRVLQGVPPEHPIDLQPALLTSQLSKKRAKTLVPSLRPSCVPPTKKGGTSIFTHHGRMQDKTVPFAQIQSFKELLENLDRLELPGQMAAALNNESLQLVLMLYPDQTMPNRIAYWLDHVLCEEFLVNPQADNERGGKLLMMLIAFSDFLKEGVPVCENFLAKYLHIWNGVDFKHCILKLVTRFRLHPFGALNDVVLEPLRKLFFCSDVYFKCQILLTLTELLRNLVTVELRRYNYTAQLQRDRDDLERSGTQLHNHFSVFTEDVEAFSVHDTLYSYVEFVDTLINVGVVTERDHCLFTHSALNFYDLVASLHTDHDLPFVSLLGRGIFYHCLFSATALPLSRVSHLLCRYGEAFTSLQRLKPDGENSKQLQMTSSRRIQVMNNYILDTCDSLWRHRAFLAQESRSVYSLLDPERLQSSFQLAALGKSFNLQHHQALLGFVAVFLDQVPPKELSSGKLEFIRNHRSAFLKFLEREGVHGVPEFIKVFIKRKT